MQKFTDVFERVAVAALMLMLMVTILFGTVAVAWSLVGDLAGIREVLSEMGQEQNTLILLLSDNGASGNSPIPSNAPFLGFKGQVWQGGVRVPMAGYRVVDDSGAQKRHRLDGDRLGHKAVAERMNGRTAQHRGQCDRA